MSEVLIEEEKPQYQMKNIVVRRKDAKPAGPAYHEKRTKTKKLTEK